jgi:hypothetical protein
MSVPRIKTNPFGVSPIVHLPKARDQGRAKCRDPRILFVFIQKFIPGTSGNTAALNPTATCTAEKG